MMLDSCRRASCLHEELLVYPQCTAVPGRGGGGGLGLQAYRGRSQGEAALLYFTRWGRQDWSTELAGRGAPGHLLLLRGRSKSYPSPVLFLKQGDARAALPCARARSMPLPLMLLSGLILISLYPPVQT